MIYYEPRGFGHVSTAIEKAIKMAGIAGDEVELNFNGDSVVVQANHGDQVYAEWSEKRAKRQSDTSTEQSK